MYIIEIPLEETALIKEAQNVFNEDDITLVELKSIDGDNILQIILPISALLIPPITQIVQSYFTNRKVSIKKDGIEISANDLASAIEAYKELRKTKNDD